MKLHILALCLLLAACGGGTPDPAMPSKDTQPVDCKTKPEACK